MFAMQIQNVTTDAVGEIKYYLSAFIHSSHHPTEKHLGLGSKEFARSMYLCR